MTRISRLADKYHLRRPTLRMQLALLYAGLFAILSFAVLGFSGLLVGSGSAEAPIGGGPPANLPPGAGGHFFQFGVASIALLAAVLALALGWWFAGRVLRPLRAISSTAQEISSTNLHQRLNIEGPADEITDLAKTLDGLLGRLEASFDAQRNFVANASHELRTPLAGQRTLLQVALADPAASAESLRVTCEEALVLGEQQERLIDALLTLASSEGGVASRVGFDLSTLAEQALASSRTSAERAGIVMVSTLMAAPASGDPRLVERLVVNLVDNAIRHNFAGGRVDVTTGVVAGRARLAVSNTGAVVDPEEVEHLFRPFERVGLGRTRGHDGSGHGLGLTIVRAIADAHGAALTASARPGGGLEVVVIFP